MLTRPSPRVSPGCPPRVRRQSLQGAARQLAAPVGDPPKLRFRSRLSLENLRQGESPAGSGSGPATMSSECLTTMSLGASQAARCTRGATPLN